jgi:phosphohistidine phosphatase
MKQLILIRHGKSSWKYSVGDQDRPLLERGINDGHLIGDKFKNEAPEIDAVFSSPANRALHTCMIVLRKMNFPLAKCRITKALYDFTGESVMNFVQGLDNDLNTVLIFGHNNAFTDVANELGSKAINNVPTTGLVHLKFDTDSWTEIDKGTTVRTLFPKQLK